MITEEEKEKLEKMINAAKTPQRQAIRARIVLLCTQEKRYRKLPRA